MKLKKIIETTDGLSADVAALYEKKADGKFHLNVEDDDGAELVRAKEHEKGLRKIAEQERDDARTALEAEKAKVTQLTNDAGKNVLTIREQLQTEYADKERKLVETHTKEKAALEGTVKKVFVGDVALRIATELSEDSDLLLPFIEKRLQVEIVGGEPVTRVLSADGKASSMTPDELRAEMLQDKKFARIIRGSGASGGGANGGKGGNGVPKALKDMNETERTDLSRSNPTEFNRLVAEDKKAKGLA